MASAPPKEGAPAAGAPENTAFADAFAAAAAAENAAEPGVTVEPVPGAAETPPAKEGEGAAETPPVKEGEGAETPPVETPPTKEGEGAAETPPAKEGEAETPPAQTPPAKEAETPPAPAAEDIVKGLAALLEQSKQPAKEGEAETPPAAEQPPIYQPDELKVIEDYEKNWPDVSKAETLKRRAEYHDLLAFTFKAVADYMKPVMDQLGAMGNVMHEQQLKQAVPDYTPDLEGEVTKWIGTQPPYLQEPMKQVMQTGTSEEVADLIGRYRAATGTAPAAGGGAAAPTPTPTPAPAKAPTTELSSAAKQAAESLAPVSGERSAVPQGEDPGDFLTAFQKYAADSGMT